MNGNFCIYVHFYPWIKGSKNVTIYGIIKRNALKNIASLIFVKGKNNTIFPKLTFL